MGSTRPDVVAHGQSPRKPKIGFLAELAGANVGGAETVTGGNMEDAKFRDNLRLARRQIDQGNAARALHLLTAVCHDAERYKGTPDWPEYNLAVAQAFALQASKGDDSAVSWFREAVQTAEALTELPDGLLVRAHLGYGKYLAGVLGRYYQARLEYNRALEVALQAGLDEERAAEIRLALITMGLEETESPEGQNFRVMRRVAERDSRAWHHQELVWEEHIRRSREGCEGRMFAREGYPVTERYFERLFKQVQISKW
jgi:hypothetical protein